VFLPIAAVAGGATAADGSETGGDDDEPPVGDGESDVEDEGVTDA
jgi:hypothetical protein